MQKSPSGSTSPIYHPFPSQQINTTFLCQSKFTNFNLHHTHLFHPNFYHSPLPHILLLHTNTLIPILPPWSSPPTHAHFYQFHRRLLIHNTSLHNHKSIQQQCSILIIHLLTQLALPDNTDDNNDNNEIEVSDDPQQSSCFQPMQVDMMRRIPRKRRNSPSESSMQFGLSPRITSAVVGRRTSLIHWNGRAWRKRSM
jgi:hypothetical protein